VGEIPTSHGAVHLEGWCVEALDRWLVEVVVVLRRCSE
jgi:hypothetical protein